jgi:hypothetical protein
VERDGPAHPRLAEAMTARLRRRALFGALATAAVGVAALVALVELAARIAVVPSLRMIEGAVAVIGVLAATVVYLRSRPAAGAWRLAADALAAEPGIFSAAGSDARATLLSPLVSHRAEIGAAELLARPAESRRLSTRSRAAVAAIVLAAAMASLPGRKSSGEDAPLVAVQARLLSEVRALRNDSRSEDAARNAVLARTAERLEATTLTADSARKIAAELRVLAHDRSSRNREIARALSKNALFREIAEALRLEDETALERAIENLVARARALPPRSAESLEAAALLLEIAAKEDDDGLKKAFADAGETLSGDGSGGTERFQDLEPPLRRVIRSSQAIRDVVVTLESAANPTGAGDSLASVSGSPVAPGAGAGGAAAETTLPSLDDLRSQARPGTSDEAVLRRYFAIR